MNKQNNNDVLHFATESINLISCENVTINSPTHKINNVNTGYRLMRPSESHYEVINNLIHDIFPNEIDKNNFMKMAKLALSGHKNDTIYVF
jgi:hypothetical protein